MLSGLDIVCFATDWDQDPLSKHHIMRRLAGPNRVLWVDSIGLRRPALRAGDAARAARKLRAFWGSRLREALPGLHVLSPLALPYHGNPAADAVNRMLLSRQVRAALRGLGMRRPVLWTFLPSAEPLAGSLGERLVVYHITDDFTRFAGHPAENIERMERRLVARADLVIASARRLAQTKAYGGKTVHVVGHGVEHAHFARALAMGRGQLPPDIAALPRPLIGFHGEINDWIDTGLLAGLARARPQWTLALVGRIAAEAGGVDRLLGLPNVRWLGQKPFAELPGYCAAFDVALIPMKLNELTRSVNPLKLREYLAAGVPVVSAPLPEVGPYGDVVRFAATAQDYITAIEELLQQDRAAIAPTLSARVAGESWDARTAEIGRLVEAALARKEIPQ
ncbi:MAG: glycosyltransferase [Candidatus Edwardsbacteria bacterium]|jgi:glycosyltransferase involved in cell wall biosynthesis|nr:glycosyltransferase [Candidatus Edwardsbacteria bacterium]